MGQLRAGRAIAGCLALGLAVGVPGGSVRAQAPQTTVAPDGVACEIRARLQGSRVDIDAVIRADVRVTGTYRLEAQMAGGGNVSRVSQSAGFEAAPGAPAEVGSVSLTGAGTASAVLTLTWGPHTVTCTRESGPG